MTRAVVAAVLPNIVKWIEGCLREGPVPTGDGFPRERTIEELEDKMRLSMENGAYEMARQIGELKKKAAAVTLSDWHRVMPHDALDWIKGYVPKLVGVLEEDILRKVRDEVTAGMAQGKTADEVTAAVEAHVNGFAKHRVETIARTESMRAYSMGAVITLRQTPDASGVEYCSILDDRTTMECQERDGMRLRIDDPRVIYNTPPLHPNCRSVLIPILGDEVPGDWKGDPEKADLLATEHPTIQREVDIEAVRRAWSAGAEASKEAAEKIALTYIADPENRKWAEEALAKAPDEIKRVFSQMEPPPQYYETSGKSCSDVLGKAIEMGPDARKDKTRYEHVFFHEMGHLVDARNVPQGSSSCWHLSEAMAEVIEADRKTFTGRLTAAKEAKLRTLRDAVAPASKWFKDPEVSDIICSMTNGKVSGYWGHSESYLKKMGYRNTEVFANMFALKAQNKTEAFEFVRSLFPATARAFEQVLPTLRGSRS